VRHLRSRQNCTQYGVPLGISFLRTAFSEPTLIKLASGFEAATQVALTTYRRSRRPRPPTNIQGTTLTKPTRRACSSPDRHSEEGATPLVVRCPCALSFKTHRIWWRLNEARENVGGADVAGLASISASAFLRSSASFGRSCTGHFRPPRDNSQVVRNPEVIQDWLSKLRRYPPLL